MRKRTSLLAVAPVAIALVVAGCGGNSSSGSGTASTAAATATPTPAAQGKVLALSADPGGQLRFTTSKLSVAKPGRITLRMANPSSAGMDHGIAIEGNGVDSDGPTVGVGQTSTVTATLKKGTYTYYCPVPGHKQAGMVGTLTVG
jgi:plastocyanin